MKTAIPREPAGSAAPAVHLEFIQNQAGLSENVGVDEVETYHRALFLHQHARELEDSRLQAVTHQERLSHLEERLAETRSRLVGQDPLVPVTIDGQPDLVPSIPWNAWDVSMFVAAALAIISLLAFGVLNISFNLLESGLVTFVESPFRAYFWAALLPVGALAVKIGWDSLWSQRSRRLYFWSCLALGLLGVVVWMAMYAAVYPSLSRSTAETLQSLSVRDEGSPTGSILSGVGPAGAKWVDAIMVASQATAEIFLSALLGIYMTMVYQWHRPVRLVGNPLYIQIDEQRRALEADVESERRALAAARGNQARLEHQLEALLSFARSLFHREVELRRDECRQKKILLDKISEQLRGQFDGLNGHSVPDTGRLRPEIPPALDR